MNSSETFSDTYLKRRTVKSGEYTTVVIKDIGHINDKTIGIIIDVAEEIFLIKCTINETWKSNMGFATLLESVDSGIKNKQIDMVFNSEMNKCGFKPDEYIFDIEYIENKDYSFVDKYSQDESLKKLLLWSEYKKSESNNKNDVGMKRKIESVNNIDFSTFNLNIFTNAGISLEWEIELPITTESESSTIARFIEEQGGGDPKQLSDLGRAIIVHQKDIDKNLNIISYDKTNQWALINPSDYETWLQNKNYNKSNIQNKRTIYRIKRNKAFMNSIFFFLVYHLIIYLRNNMFHNETEETILAIISLAQYLYLTATVISFICVFVYMIAVSASPCK